MPPLLCHSFGPFRAGSALRLECRTLNTLFLGAQPMTNGIPTHRRLPGSSIAASVCFWVAISPAFAQQSAPRDPAEPQQAHHPYHEAVWMVTLMIEQFRTELKWLRKLRRELPRRAAARNPSYVSQG